MSYYPKVTRQYDFCQCTLVMTCSTAITVNITTGNVVGTTADNIEVLFILPSNLAKYLQS